MLFWSAEEGFMTVMLFGQRSVPEVDKDRVYDRFGTANETV